MTNFYKNHLSECKEKGICPHCLRPLEICPGCPAPVAPRLDCGRCVECPHLQEPEAILVEHGHKNDKVHPCHLETETPCRGHTIKLGMSQGNGDMLKITQTLYHKVYRPL